MLDNILEAIHHFIHKNQYLDTYVQNIISDKTGFKANKIKLLKASKSDIEHNNNFDTFSFKYEGIIYDLDKNDKLTISKNQEY